MLKYFEGDCHLCEEGTLESLIPGSVRLTDEPPRGVGSVSGCAFKKGKDYYVWIDPFSKGKEREFIKKHELEHIRAWKTDSPHPNCRKDGVKLAELHKKYGDKYYLI